MTHFLRAVEFALHFPQKYHLFQHKIITEIFILKIAA